jgi:2-polyprenyl-3-methyl-5-hydroxy-6-metoxy-1,4-benzoquinol methylase
MSQHFSKLRNNEKTVYEGRDLESMSLALNYHRWVLDIFSPYLGARIVEVGAGSGSCSELLLMRPIESFTAVEPSVEMYQLLKAHLALIRSSAKIDYHNSVFRQVAASIRSEQEPDSIVYVNVLEHIEDDVNELVAMNETLKKGGRIFIFVPALTWLYGAFDRQIQHFRRYTKAELEGKCQQAGFELIKSHYFDLPGILPWWVKYRVLKSTSLGPGAVKLYDKLAVPFIRIAESIITPPIGKNLILIAEKQ